MPEEISSRVARIKDEISQAAVRSGRSASDVRILAATKTRNIAEIISALKAGIDLVGENRIQEALGKFEFLPPNTEKHMIGTLQPNKVRTAVQLFELIQSVNSFELAQAIDKAARELEITFPVLIEVNPADEDTKSGASKDIVAELVEQIQSLENIDLRGLMAMLPFDREPESLRPLFMFMREMFEEFKAALDENFDVLSMGMSNDYIVAVEEGSTMIRLGTTIFGPRIR